MTLRRSSANIGAQMLLLLPKYASSYLIVPESPRILGRVTRLTESRLAVAAYFFVNGGLFATWAARIPGIREGLSLSEARLGVALLGLGLGTFLAWPVTSLLIARLGSGPVTVASAVACCAVLPAAAWAASLGTLFAVLLLFGMAMGCMDVAMNAQATLVERAAARSLMASFHGLWSLGGLTGAGLGILIADTTAPRTHFAFVAAALVLVSLAAWGRTVREPGETAGSFTWPSRAVVAIGVVGACGLLVEGGIADWSGVYLRSALGTTAGFAAAGYAAFSFAMTIGRFTGDRLIDRFGRLALLRAGSSLTAAALAVALLWRDPYVAVAALVAAGLGMATVFPIAFGLAGRVHAAPGHAIAAVATMAYGGGLLGPPTIGFAARAASLPVALWLLVAASVAITALAGRSADEADEPQGLGAFQPTGER
jgi:fucose permease